MAERVNGIEELDELKKAKAAQGMSVPNYNEWNNILADLDELNIRSTGSYEGDVALHRQLEAEAEEYATQMQVQQAQQVQQTQVQQPEKVAKTDEEQNIKATVANAVSSDIMANYMKVFHML